MSLRNEITPEFIANSIYQDTFKGYYVLVEGDSDEAFYSTLLNESLTQIEICHGKENTIKALEIINQREKKKDKSIAIIDKDYDFLHNPEYPKNLIQTDNHDIEVMCLNSTAFTKSSKEMFSRDKIKKFESTIKKPIKQHIIDLITPIAKLRIVSITENLNLSFKAQDNNQKDLEYKNFICKDTFTFLGYDTLIESIKKFRSQALHLELKKIKESITNLNIGDYDIFDICHGHDLTKTISIGMKKVLGKNKLTNIDSEEIERYFRLSYSSSHFNKTQLSNKLKAINPEIVSD